MSRLTLVVVRVLISTYPYQTARNVDAIERQRFDAWRTENSEHHYEFDQQHYTRSSDNTAGLYLG
ncbi:hypothetical protein [Pseudomonas sivasensis]|uniref:hypothetical protein n=1 Tax=Pseudomonas sivasensis TaxID=1880678 RepID=UPI0015C4996B|nr:hypothetical protein [Pseudomonas sivasensis]